MRKPDDQLREIDAVETVAPASIPFAEALRYWLKLGFLSFGGPTGQIAIMHQELVERRRWISEHRFLHALNYCMVLPGPEAQQLATYIGWLMHGARGGIAAGVLFVLPSLFILIVLTWIYLTFGEVPAIAGILYGIKPAVTAIVLFAAYRIGSRALANAALGFLAAAAFVAIFVFSVPFPYIVLGAGVIGYVGGHVAPAKFRTGGHAVGAVQGYGPALIDDDTPPPEHARFQWPRIVGYGMLGLAVWIGAEGLLYATFGWQGTLTQMGWFFTKAALLTFGGAYAVLPYVYQGGVEHYQWLTATQMIDGLALGETTPGPLIMIVTFVGFVGGWTKALFGSDALAGAGVAGALVATLFTFLPSFLFILVGAPAVEATRGDIKFTAPLTGITAAVVGVILNLAVFFAYHVLWPHSIPRPLAMGTLFSGFEWMSALIGIAAFIALWRLKVGVIPVIGACALAGLTRTLAL
jgi:chromate transporter